MLLLAAPTSARHRIPLNQWVPAHRGSLVCPGTREGAPPHIRFAAIIIVAARVAAPIVPFHAVLDQTVSQRVLSGADLGRRHLVPQLAKKHGVSNDWFQEDFTLLRTLEHVWAYFFHFVVGRLFFFFCRFFLAP